MNVLLLIGGSRGLGRALVDIFHKESWSVLEFSRTGPVPFNHTLDLNHPFESLNSFTHVTKSLDQQNIIRVVMILNSAAILPIRNVAKLTPQEIQSSVNINITSAILLCQAYVSLFRNFARPKMLINIGSGAAHRGFPGWSLYCAGKAAMESFFRALHEEENFEPHPFTVFTYDPHVMDTQMQAEIRQSSETEFPLVEHFRKLHSGGQLTPPEKVAIHLYALIERPDIFKNRFDYNE